MDASPSAAPENADARKDMSGSTLGEFRLQRRLGVGGMGEVYLAEQLSLKRNVAIKVMRPELTANPNALTRFQSEAMAIARLTHPNIVQVYAIGEQDGVQFIALEFVEGASLGSYMTRKGPLRVDLTLKILKQVAAALEHAGGQGIAHRDIKPENILITKKADAKVTDFGLARSTEDEDGQVHVTQSGVIVGTPVYMSPEQVQGKKLDCRTDIYSLGVTAYHMLAGRPPYQGTSAFDLAFQHVQSTPPSLRQGRPDVPAELEAVIVRMMTKSPDERYANGRDLLRALAQVPTALAIGAADRLTAEVAMGPGNRTEALDGKPLRKRSKLQTDKPLKKKRSVVLWIVLGAALLLVPVIAVAAFVAYRLNQASEKAPDAVQPVNRDTPAPPPIEPVRPSPDRPAQPPDLTREEQKLRDALPRSFTYNDSVQFRKEFQAYVDMAAFFLRTKQYDKADIFFGELSKPGPKPQWLFALGEAGLGVSFAFRGQRERSLQFLNHVNSLAEPTTGGRRAPRHVLHNPSLRPLVIEALDLDAKGGKLPPDLQKLRKSLERDIERDP